MKKNNQKPVIPTPEPKLKKIPSGPIREKTRTINKILTSVGKVLQKKGYANITIINVAKEAKVSPKLIYLYFGNLDTLIETFIKQSDFWNMADKTVLEDILKDLDNVTKNDVTKLLLSQYVKLRRSKLFQKVIHWELGESIPILRKIVDTREEITDPIFDVVEKDFEKSEVDIRALLAIQMAGINYLALQSSTGSTFCGINFNDENDIKKISKALEYNIDLLYKQI